MSTFLEIIRGIFPERKHQLKKISIRGPLEDLDGKMMLLIPLDAGGRDLAPFTKGIGVVADGYLRVEIQPWLAEKIDVHIGSLVDVDNLEGEFRITRTGEEAPNQALLPTTTAVTPPAAQVSRQP